MSNELKFFFPYTDGYYIVYMVNSAENVVSILDSHLHNDDDVKKLFINYILETYPNMRKRTAKSLLREWKAHNILYNMGIEIERTRTSDLDAYEKWYRRVGYFFITLFFKER